MRCINFVNELFPTLGVSYYGRDYSFRIIHILPSNARQIIVFENFLQSGVVCTGLLDPNGRRMEYAEGDLRESKEWVQPKGGDASVN